MVGISFRGPTGRPMAGAVISIASAPGEISDIAMVADDWGEIVVDAPEPGDYRFLIAHAGQTFHAGAHLASGENYVWVNVG